MLNVNIAAKRKYKSIKLSIFNINMCIIFKKKKTHKFL